MWSYNFELTYFKLKELYSMSNVSAIFHNQATIFIHSWKSIFFFCCSHPPRLTSGLLKTCLHAQVKLTVEATQDVRNFQSTLQCLFAADDTAVVSFISYFDQSDLCCVLETFFKHKIWMLYHRPVVEFFCYNCCKSWPWAITTHSTPQRNIMKKNEEIGVRI